MIELIDFDKRTQDCYFCGKHPVKYEVKVFDEMGRIKTVCSCNLCVLIRNTEILHI